MPLPGSGKRRSNIAAADGRYNRGMAGEADVDKPGAGSAGDEGPGRPAAQVAALQRLGIDVWTRRRPRARPTPAARVPARGPGPPRGRPASMRPATGPAPAQPPARAPEAAAADKPFRIHCFHFGRVFAAVAEDAWPQRRLLQDAALAMNAFAPAERKDILFDWPLPGAPPNGAERAFRAFFGHQTRSAPRTLVAGGRVAQLIGRPAPASCALLEGHLYIPAGHLDAAAKKALWRLIRESGQ